MMSRPILKRKGSKWAKVSEKPSSRTKNLCGKKKNTIHVIRCMAISNMWKLFSFLSINTSSCVLWPALGFDVLQFYIPLSDGVPRGYVWIIRI